MRQLVWTSLLNKAKSNSYPEDETVKSVDIWNERDMPYPGRSHGHGEMKFEPWSKTVRHEKSAEAIVLVDLVRQGRAEHEEVDENERNKE